MRTLRTLIALLVSLLITATVYAQNQGEIMKDQKQLQTLCLGRFLVDVPKDTEMVGQSSEYRGDSVSLTRRVSQEAFQKVILDKEKVLKETKHETEPSLLKHISRSGDGNSVVMVFWKAPTTGYLYVTEAYKWTKGYQFLIKSYASRDKVPMALELANRTLAELQYRRDNEIPTTPGFCIDGGFFAGEPLAPNYESRVFNLRLKSHPDVRFVITSRTNGEQIAEGLLARIDRKPTPEIFKALEAQGKMLRRGAHRVGEMDAEEMLEAVATGEGYLTHLFFWEAGGKPRNIYAPSIVVKLETGMTPTGSITRPSLTDKQAIELFDSIVNSIRLRPNGSSAATPENSPPPPRPQSKVPLGTTLASDTRCPQTGTWVCDQPDALGGHRRVFREGQTLPSIVAPVKLGLWQKLKGDAPNRLNSTAWTLVELPPEVAS